MTDPAEPALYAGSVRAGQQGTPIVGYGAIDTLEGTALDGVLIHRFPSVEDARAWYERPAYQAALPHRRAGADHRVFIVEGVDDTQGR